MEALYFIHSQTHLSLSANPDTEILYTWAHRSFKWTMWCSALTTKAKFRRETRTVVWCVEASTSRSWHWHTVKMWNHPGHHCRYNDANEMVPPVELDGFDRMLAATNAPTLPPQERNAHLPINTVRIAIFIFWWITSIFCSNFLIIFFIWTRKWLNRAYLFKNNDSYI